VTINSFHLEGKLSSDKALYLRKRQIKDLLIAHNKTPFLPVQCQFFLLQFQMTRTEQGEDEYNWGYSEMLACNFD
jgi:hypothetical protein